MKGLRDLFRGLKTGYFYRLNSDGAQATSTIGKAKYKVFAVTIWVYLFKLIQITLRVNLS